MQTFMISSDFRQTARALDNKRLNKQLLEVRQIFAANLGLTKGWVNHPATKMWRHSPEYLFEYATAIADELRFREIKWESNYLVITQMLPDRFNELPVYPSWIDDKVLFDKVATSHRANLYLKDPGHYADFEVDWRVFEANRDVFTCCDRCNYYWPTHKE